MSAIKNHEAISPTAKLVAFWRSFSDIPYSQDVSILCEAERVTNDLFAGILGNADRQSVLPGLLEVRYKSLRQFLLRHRYTQVLEFASGISLRGLAMTSDPSLTYVDTDLATLTNEKKKLVQAIADKYQIPTRPNLFTHVANILNYEEIEPALAHFTQQKPLAIIHEGLLPYLPMREKSIATKNIHRILTKYPGAWITPDLDTRQHIRKLGLPPEQFKTFTTVVEKVTGSNFEENAFEDDNEVQQFFNEHGFDVQCEPQLQHDIEVSSLANMADPATVMGFLKNLRLWVLTIKK